MISAPPVQLATLPEAAWAVARRLGQALRPDAIFLFGSHARGEAGPHSDLDFLVVVAASSCTRLASAATNPAESKSGVDGDSPAHLAGALRPAKYFPWSRRS